MDILPDIPVLAGLSNDTKAPARHHARAGFSVIAMEL
jgi:hypothetical protein